MFDVSTCDHYSPPEEALEHDGTEENPKYDLNIRVRSHLCLNKHVRGDNAVAMCNFLTTQQNCPFYESERTEEVLDMAETEDGVKIILLRHLTKFNFVTYSVIEQTIDEETGKEVSTPVFSIDEHKTDQASVLAGEHFSEHTSQLNATPVDLPEVEKKDTSYLNRVATV